MILLLIIIIKLNQLSFISEIKNSNKIDNAYSFLKEISQNTQNCQSEDCKIMSNINTYLNNNDDDPV